MSSFKQHYFNLIIISVLFLCQTSVLGFVNETKATRWWTDLNDFKTTGIWMWGQDVAAVKAQQNLL